MALESESLDFEPVVQIVAAYCGCKNSSPAAQNSIMWPQTGLKSVLFFVTLAALESFCNFLIDKTKWTP
jgi:hypothetical protein